ncbi:MAG: bifunctional phosphopantothenoylcysteine decarboxylase/phosphopantothenate--cysteine ligase CoaBC [Candidatus Coatesbacteria bacterium]|nr:bifunctional phosphopantothenoylcysteine decarboxylase/phosphopantothenate--cysteine ligase CoaBC [Candidatus Coatesbacteria bacterium]
MTTEKPDCTSILLGVSGGIAAYKSAEIVRLLKKRGFDVKVVLTENGARFIGAETLAALSGHQVYTEMFARSRSEYIGHIALSDWADMLLVAPATANIIGKFANGIADDLLSTVFLSCDCPVLIAPAMNVRMYSHRVVQENIEKLGRLGAAFVGPDTGELACGSSGRGRMSQPEAIVDEVASMAKHGKDLAGLSILVSAGPTREMIDPVRFISNRSTGKMGIAIARAAAARGAKVTLVAGPCAVELPSAVEVVNVTSAEQMRDAIIDALPKHQVLIMTAAVADYTPAQPLSQKIKKGESSLSLELVRTSDILVDVSELRAKDQVIIGFAAETENLLDNARKKLAAKGLDMIVANDVSRADSGFGVATIAATLLWPDGRQKEVPLSTKDELANAILSEVIALRTP